MLRFIIYWYDTLTLEIIVIAHLVVNINFCRNASNAFRYILIDHVFRQLIYFDHVVEEKVLETFKEVPNEDILEKFWIEEIVHEKLILKLFLLFLILLFNAREFWRRRWGWWDITFTFTRIALIRRLILIRQMRFSYFIKCLSNIDWKLKSSYNVITSSYY